MADIYIIAGPPGIGKSTLGHNFIPPDMDILNEDEMRFKYKARAMLITMNTLFIVSRIQFVWN